MGKASADMSNLSELRLYATKEHDCSYLKGEQATTLFVDPHADIDNAVYSALSDLGFRRSGQHVYKPHCNDCKACISVRVPVHSFMPKRSHKRCLKANSDLKIIRTQTPDMDEHYNLYERYIATRHADGDMYPPNKSQFLEFLNNPFNATYYIEMRDLDGKLLGCAVSDQLEEGLSAIYTYFDPIEVKRSLGRFAVLYQIECAKKLGLKYLYLGYWIKQCQKMQYKSEYRPLQLLINQRWVTAS